MANVIVAPDVSFGVDNLLKVFLGGGINKCKNWQSEVIDNLNYLDINIYNPRQNHFDITEVNAAPKQIKWEFDRLNCMDIFTMYFCASESVQPICMYELGRYIARMQMRFPSTWQDRIVVSVERGYSRELDVVEQLK